MAMTALALENLSKTYRNGHEALRGIGLEVEQGDWAIGGKRLGASDVHALAASKAA